MLGPIRDYVLYRKFQRIPYLPREQQRQTIASLTAQSVHMRQAHLRHHNLKKYSLYSVGLGGMHTESDDFSVALHPLGAGYLAACLGGPRLRLYRRQALGDLIRCYWLAGDNRRSAECAIEFINVSRIPNEQIPIFDFLSAVIDACNLHGPQLDLYEAADQLTTALQRDEPETGHAIRVFLESSIAGHPTESFRNLSKAFDFLRSTIDEEDSLPLVAGAMAMASAVDESRSADALEIANYLRIRGRKVLADVPFANLLAHIGRQEVQLGMPERALQTSLESYSLSLSRALLCKNDYVREYIRACSRSAVDLALKLATIEGDELLVAELIENTRAQASLDIVEPVDYLDGIIDHPGWQDEAIEAALATDGSEAGVLAYLSGDWITGLASQVFVSVGGRSRLLDSLGNLHRDREIELKTIDSDSHLEHAANSNGYWAAYLAEGKNYYWSFFQHSTVATGHVHLNQTMVESINSLTAAVTPGSGIVPPIDAVYALSTCDGWEERQLLTPLSRLIPPPIAALAREASTERPISVLFAPAPELATIPYAALPLDSESIQTRLVERVLLRLQPPASVQRHLLESTFEESDGSSHPLRLVCWNPDGTLGPGDPVQGDILLDGTSNSNHGDATSSGITSADFLNAVSEISNSKTGSVFIRAHLAASEYGRWAGEFGIGFTDEVLTTRRLLARVRSHDPELRLPPRLVLAMCSSAGSHADAGYSLGFAVACSLLGAREQVLSLYNVFDSAWSVDLDHQLAEAARHSPPLPLALRNLQLDALAQWRTRFQGHGPDYEGPTPFVWGAYITT
jgi:hypothetical protein